MSFEEMREYCQSLSSFNLRVQVRLKNGRESMTGKIANVGTDRFELVGDDNVAQLLRFAWVANIKNG